MTKRFLLFLPVLLFGFPATAEEIEVTTEPQQLVLGKIQSAQIVVRGLPGEGLAYADANVGQIERIDPVDNALKLAYRLPKETFPQTLCLLLWRGNERHPEVYEVRVPLFGETRIPVKTRAAATVRVNIAGKMFGPVTSGRQGQVNIPVLVPPKVDSATIRVTDRMGLYTERELPITVVPFNQLAIAVVADPAPHDNKQQFEITIVAAHPREQRPSPRLRIDERPVSLTETRPGRWVAHWSTRRSSDFELRVPITIRIPGEKASMRRSDVIVSKQNRLVLADRPPREATPQNSRSLRVRLGVTTGMLHNLGSLIAPRFGLDLGLEYRLPFGFVGLSFLAGYSWANQKIQGQNRFPAANSHLTLLPFGATLSYRAKLPYLTPYVQWGALAQLTRVENDAPFLARSAIDQKIHFAVLSLVGASRALGPGRLFLQGGFQWSRAENQDLKALTGGVIMEGGYRFEL